jgi:hypothetical protein
MSFSIERYKEESKKLDTTGIDWNAVKQHGLSKGDLFCLHYRYRGRVHAFSLCHGAVQLRLPSRRLRPG